MGSELEFTTIGVTDSVMLIEREAVASPDYDPTDQVHLVAHYFSGLGTFSTNYMRNRYIADLKNRGYRHKNVPRGWAKEILVNGQTVALDDRTDRINLDELFTKLTTTCPLIASSTAIMP